MNLRKNLAALPKTVFYNDKLCFREIRSEDDLAAATCDLLLPADQQAMVNPAGFSIGRAYLFPDDNIPYLICKPEHGKEIPIGFILLRFSHWTDDENTWSRYIKHEPRMNWSYFIVPEYQGMGYGISAAELAVSILIKAAPGYAIELTTEQENTRAQSLYEKIGFVKADELDGDDFVFLYNVK